MKKFDYVLSGLQMRQNVSVTHKTRSALYEIEYRLEYILRKINFEKLRISVDWGGGDVLQVYNITEVIIHKDR